jgi:hypothetical protein
MTINLSSYKQIATGMFVRIDVPDYQVLRFSDYYQSQTINGEIYQPLGQLLAITDTTSSIRATQGNMSISISGIPNSSIAEVLSIKLKGSPIQVWRVFFDAATGTQLAISGNPAGRFQGIVSNFSLEEEIDMMSRTQSNKILMTCSSAVDVLNNKVSGRRTNERDEKSLYSTDKSFDRVVALRNSNFNFGAP